MLLSGDIDFDEFKQLVYDGLLLEGAIQDYEDAFNAVDNSGNGSIGKQHHIQQKGRCQGRAESVASVTTPADNSDSMRKRTPFRHARAVVVGVART